VKKKKPKIVNRRGRQVEVGEGQVAKEEQLEEGRNRYQMPELVVLPDRPLDREAHDERGAQ
jgi:hypothetical protein